MKWIRDKRKELANRQHDYGECRQESSKWRADELQKFEDEWRQSEQFVLDVQVDVDQKHHANAQNQTNLVEVEAELKKAEERIQVE